MDRTFAVAIGGVAGQGVATPGNMFAKLFARRGLHINAHNAYVTYNHGNTYAWFRERVQNLEDDPSYDSFDWHEAVKRAMLWGDEIPIGKFFQRTDLPSLDQAESILDHGAPLLIANSGLRLTLCAVSLQS